MLRKQVYFAVATFIILCVTISIAYFVFGFSLSPADRPISPQSSTANTRPSFLFELFFLIISLVMLLGGTYSSYFVWFQSDKVRVNLERTRELAQKGELVSLWHDYSNINTEVYIWFMRLFSPLIVFLGFIFFSLVINSFQKVVFSCC